MTLEKSFIEYVKNKQPAMWDLIRMTAEKDRLIVIDEENDAVTATNRLLWTNPGLHECLSTIVNEWTNDHLDGDILFKSLVNNIADTGKEHEWPLKRR
jgi:hypothetical protein